MDLQTLFYVIGIVFMLTILLIVIGGAVLVWYIRKKALQLITSPQKAFGGIASALAFKLRNKKV